MSEDTKIQWATHTFNPWEGCTKVSPGCANCYAEARNHRFGMDNWGKGKPRRRTSAATWRNPVKWNRAAAYHNARLLGREERPRVFPSLCDWLDDEVPTEWLADFMRLIHDTPNLDWLLLTKRPENFHSRIQAALWNVEGLSEGDDGDSEDLPATDTGHMLNNWIGQEPPHNVWIGVSIEDQKRADERIPELLKIPAAVRFLSVEPLLSPVDLRLPAFKALGLERVLTGYEPAGEIVVKIGAQIHWAIFGGESGPGARPCNIEWIRDGVKQCRDAGVPVFVKQLGAVPCRVPKDIHIDWSRVKTSDKTWREGDQLIEIKDKKGGDPSEWPEDLRVREFPKLALIARV